MTWKAGDPLTAAQLRSVVDAVLWRFTGEGIRVGASGGSVLLGRDFERSSVTSARQFVIKAWFDDVLDCRSLDANGNEGSGRIWVAKPWALRITPWDVPSPSPDGIDYTYVDDFNRTYFDPSIPATRSQIMVPRYRTDWPLFAIKQTAPVEFVDPYTLETARTHWIDLNVDGRKFWGEPLIPVIILPPPP